MRKILSLLASMLAIVSVNAQKAEFFEPYQSVDLRLPSVPIFVNDPYFSIWSSYDQLTDGPTSYWYARNVEKPIDGILRVDGTSYRFMGTEHKYIIGDALLPMADEGAWTAPSTFTVQSGTDWTQPDFDDSRWKDMKGAFGSSDYKNVNTEWKGNGTDVYTRRTVEMTAEDIQKDLLVVYSHDDVFELYINGHRVISTGETWLEGEVLVLTEQMRGYLKEGKNVLAAHCHNTTGGSLMDFGFYFNNKKPLEGVETAKQLSVDVLATNSYYTFECGPVELDVVFTAPMLIDDLDLLSTPVNYMSTQVRSTDGKEHSVQLYFAASPKISTFKKTDGVIANKRTSSDKTYSYLRVGNRTQTFHETESVNSIDWGYLYLPDFNGEISLAMPDEAESAFVATGKLAESKSSHTATKEGDYPVLSYLHDFGTTQQASSYLLIGYDEVNDIQFLGKRYKGYWARNGKSIQTAFSEMNENYDEIMTKCRQLDKRIYDDGLAAANKKYAEVLSGAYRHCIAAHKLFEDADGDLLFFSRENDSGGFINTVDLTYPESPLFLMYNHELQKAMMTSMFKYCESNRWGFNFCAHDIGHYPIADNQHYAPRFPEADGGFGGNMPLEESGNMVTLAATISMLDGNTEYADRFWNTITTWANYLRDNGQDPENQLCTDDFAGHLAHNANLSLKAIFGVAGYAYMCKIKGLNDEYETYMNKAKEMAAKWEKDAMDPAGDHYKLALDRDGTWSQKYNMVWDKLWKINIIPNDAMQTEMKYYLTKRNTYGLPLDSRENYTKADWILWTATMAETKTNFQRFSDQVWKYVNETNSRVPISDWYWATNGNLVGFRARSVVGGFWMKVLMDHFDPEIPHSTNINGYDRSLEKKEAARYNANGQLLKQPTKGLNIIKYTDGTTEKKFVR